MKNKILEHYDAFYNMVLLTTLLSNVTDEKFDEDAKAEDLVANLQSIRINKENKTEILGKLRYRMIYLYAQRGERDTYKQHPRHA